MHSGCIYGNLSQIYQDLLDNEEVKRVNTEQNILLDEVMCSILYCVCGCGCVSVHYVNVCYTVVSLHRLKLIQWCSKESKKISFMSHSCDSK